MPTSTRISQTERLRISNRQVRKLPEKLNRRRLRARTETVLLSLTIDYFHDRRLECFFLKFYISDVRWRCRYLPRPFGSRVSRFVMCGIITSTPNSDANAGRGGTFGDEDKSHGTTWPVHIDPTLGTEQVRANRVELYFGVSDSYLECLDFVSAYVLLVNAFRHKLDPDFFLINVYLQKFQNLVVELIEMASPFFKLSCPINRAFSLVRHLVLTIHEVFERCSHECLRMMRPQWESSTQGVTGQMHHQGIGHAPRRDWNFPSETVPRGRGHGRQTRGRPGRCIAPRTRSRIQASARSSSVRPLAPSPRWLAPALQ